MNQTTTTATAAAAALGPYYQEPGVELYQGDALDVLPALARAGRRFDYCFADPPYSSGGGVRRDSGAGSDYYSADDSQTANNLPEFTGEKLDQLAYVEFTRLWLNKLTPLMNDGSLVGVFTNARMLTAVDTAMQFSNVATKGIFTWIKPNHRRLPGRRYSHGAEFMVWGAIGKRPGVGAGGVVGYHIESARIQDRLHRTEKPVGLMKHLLKLARPGETVLDPFVGSGTTLVAAREMGLSAVGVELSQAYCDIAVRRLTEGV